MSVYVLTSPLVSPRGPNDGVVLGGRHSSLVFLAVGAAVDVHAARPSSRRPPHYSLHWLKCLPPAAAVAANSRLTAGQERQARAARVPLIVAAPRRQLAFQLRQLAFQLRQLLLQGPLPQERPQPAAGPRPTVRCSLASTRFLRTEHQGLVQRASRAVTQMTDLATSVFEIVHIFEC